MLVAIPKLLNEEQLGSVRQLLQEAGPAWVDGRVTAGYQGPSSTTSKSTNVPKSRGNASTLCCQRWSVIRVSSAPACPISFTHRCSTSEGMTFGAHVDGSVRIHPNRKLRTDVSATLFLSDPADYDGGELQIDDTYGLHSVKLAAGDIVVYPSTSLHQVTPVTRGVRVACFLWVQSLVRDDAQRSMMYDMDNAIQTFNQTGADEGARRTLIGCYHNLMRQWAET